MVSARTWPWRLSACRRPSSSPPISSVPGEKLWIRDVTVTTGLVDTFSIPRLMRLIASGRMDPTLFATHRFALQDTMAAYDTFAAAADTGALKVVLSGSERRGAAAQPAREMATA